MKKWILLITIVLAAGIFFLLPAEQTLTQSFDAPVPVSATTRLISDLRQWDAWWPGEKLNDSTFKSGKREFSVGKIMLTSFDATSRKDETEISLNVRQTPSSGDQTRITLFSSYRFSENRLKRLAQYPDYLSWKKEFSAFAGQLHDFFTDIRKVYGCNIEKQKVPNSPHVALIQSYPEHPTWDEVYGLIDELRQYVISQNATVVNDPIMNIFIDEGKFKVMVAVATNRVLPSSGRFMLKEMVLGNILVAEVKGGSDKVRECQTQMENYVRDFQKSSPAIPFQRLITDRSRVKDSTQWITTVNYPVFE